MLVADNGNNWSLSGVADSRWNDTTMAELGTVAGKNFEVVKMNEVVT